MPEDFAPDDFEAADALVIDVEGFEGPLDLLLTMARGQKVDLRKISILQLAESYLAFVAEARRLRIELAAEYLVMAAWLAFLKSRLLLPPPHDDGPSGEEMAEALALRLAHLEKIREAAARLMSRDQLGRDFFARGEAEPVERGEKRVQWGASLSDLLKAYASIRTREAYQPLHFRRPPVLALEEAFERLRDMLGRAALGWTSLAEFLPPDWLGDDTRRRSALASTFLATLELAKRGEAELRQDGHFRPLMVRRAA